MKASLGLRETMGISRSALSSEAKTNVRPSVQ